MSETKDSYHTMDELYDYRMAYNAAFFKLLAQTNLPARVHKSRKHNDGESCFGGKYFVVMAELPSGQISNHYKLEHWDLFDVEERELSDVWDGHTPEVALQRIKDFCMETKNIRLLNENEEEVLIAMNPDSEYCVNYRYLEGTKGLDRKGLEPIIKHLKELGMIDFYRGLMFEDGGVAGSGWCRSHKGNQYIEDNNL